MFCRYRNSSVRNGGQYAHAQDLATCTTELSVLMQHYNCTFQIWAVISESTWIFTAIVNASLAIVKLSPRSTAMVIAVSTILLYLFKRMGNVYTESRELLSEFLPTCSTPWFRRTCKAYRPLRVNVGTFYYADRTLVLTILTIILTNTASLVVACLS